VTSDRLYKRLKSLIESGAGDIWPDKVRLHDEELAWRVFLVLEAWADGDGCWRFLPSQILAEDWQMLEDLMQLRHMMNLTRKEQEQREREDS
jgi:hypothetical protein